MEKGKLYQKKNGFKVIPHLGWEQSVAAIGYGVCVWNDGHFLKLDCSDDCTTLYAKYTSIIMLKIAKIFLPYGFVIYGL